MSKDVRRITFGHSGEIKINFESQDVDTKVRFEGTNFDDTLFWIANENKDAFTEDFKLLVEKYFI